MRVINIDGHYNKRFCIVLISYFVASLMSFKLGHKSLIFVTEYFTLDEAVENFREFHIMLYKYPTASHLREYSETKLRQDVREAYA